MAAIEDLLADLAAEGADLDALVAPLDAAAWRAATPAPGWTVAHQIAHLAWTDEVAALAATDPGAFGALVAEALKDAATYVDRAADEGAQAAPEDVLAGWRASRAALAAALQTVEPGRKLPWFGPPMGAPAMATARIMETWAHGQDVADALGVRRVPTARLKHVAWLGLRTRDFSFFSHGLQPPAEEFRIELTGPDGDLWAWGPEPAAQRVTGDALDFCLLVTRRRHPADLTVRAEGPDAERWLEIAQAFAGPAGEGREKGQFA